MVTRVKKERKMPKVFIIAEAGVNHNGSLKVAKKMVDAAAGAGADAIKFQTFNAQAMVSKYAPKAEYQKISTGKRESQFEMIRKLELSAESHKALLVHCRKKKILFLSSPFDLKSIEILVRLGLKIFKIPSGEITNFPYLCKIGSLRKKVILSTGMANNREIKRALDLLVENGTRRECIAILQCNTEYPTQLKDANLLAMQAMKNKFKVRVGYSDHTLGVEATIAAVALGASVIEKHFTLDKNMSGPDHKASLDCKELRDLVIAVRKTEEALGSKVKKPTSSELRNIMVVRKSIVASNHIKRGEVFSQDNLAVKRPGTGIDPMKWEHVVGKIAKKDFLKDEMIKI